VAFPEGFVEEVRRAADIVRTISGHVTLKKMGTSWKGLCPFHQEKTPSFNVRAEPPLFHCFGCGEGGDVFKFVMLHERVGFPEAVESLARRFGVPLPERSFEVGPDRKQREEQQALMETAAEHYAKTLWTAAGIKAREYLLNRGFKKQTLERIRAGAARDSWSDLFDALRGKFSPAALLSAGLVLEKQGGKGYYDRFRNRVMFPIPNESAKTVAFGARTLDGSEPKYLNSPETALYQKGRVLYGLGWAKEAIRAQGRVVLMEGYLDVARAMEAGVEEAVASCGTALTGGQARLLRRFTDVVIVNFDQDAAGQKAARKSFDVLLEEGLKVHVAELPEGHDPDSYLRERGADAYRQRLGEAPVYMEWLIARAAVENETRTPPGKAAFLSALLPSLVRMENAVERAAWLQLIVDRGDLDARAAEQELRRALGRRAGSAPLARIPPPALRGGLLMAEKLLLARILKEAAGVDEALAELAEEDLSGLATSEALRAAKAIYLRGETVTATMLAQEVQNDETRKILTEIAVQDVPTEGVTARDCVRELKRLPLRARMAEIQRDLPKAHGESLEALLQEKLELGRLMANL